MHAAILAGFPPEPAGVSHRVLWRVDRVGRDTHLLIASPAEPDLTHLVEQAGWPTTATWACRPYARVLDALAPGDVWAFRTTVNPTKSTKMQEGARSQRLAHVTVQQQTDWLLARLGGHGAEIVSSDVGSHIQLVYREVIRFRRQTSTVTLARATFHGQLRVTDPARLRDLLTGGLGPAKAYGCGLVTLAKA